MCRTTWADTAVIELMNLGWFFKFFNETVENPGKLCSSCIDHEHRKFSWKTSQSRKMPEEWNLIGLVSSWVSFGLRADFDLTDVHVLYHTWCVTCLSVSIPSVPCSIVLLFSTKFSLFPCNSDGKWERKWSLGSVGVWEFHPLHNNRKTEISSDISNGGPSMILFTCLFGLDRGVSGVWGCVAVGSEGHDMDGETEMVWLGEWNCWNYWLTAESKSHLAIIGLV